MPGLLTAISVGFSAVVLVQAQTIAPGPAAPGGPNPYGVGPGGISVAPGSGSTTPSTTAPEGTRVSPDVREDDRKEARRRGVKRPRVSDDGIASAPRRASARHRGCWRCRYSWTYSGAYYLWPAPYYAGASGRRFYANYVRQGWGPPYAGGYFAVIVPTRVNGW
jgi:hypothetical protein